MQPAAYPVFICGDGLREVNGEIEWLKTWASNQNLLDDP